MKTINSGVHTLSSEYATLRGEFSTVQGIEDGYLGVNSGGKYSMSTGKGGPRQCTIFAESWKVIEEITNRMKEDH
jgi:hypothetical protein